MKLIEYNAPVRTKRGIRVVVISLILLAALIALNIVMAILPKSMTLLDSSANKMYTLDEKTEKYIKSVSSKVVMYFLANPSEEDSQFYTYLSRVASLNSNISLKYIDIATNPTFYETYSSTALSSNDIIFESDLRYKVMPYSDLYYFYNEDIGKMSIDEYQSFIMQLYMYGYDASAFPVTTYFDGENSILSSLDYVTTTEFSTIYCLTGHGEQALSSKLIDMLDYYNMETKPLSIILESEIIPENASCILINAPTNDITESESIKLKAYMANGGNVFVSTMYNTTSHENLLGILSDFDVSAVDGLVYEDNAGNHISGYPYYIYSNIDKYHEYSSGITNNYVFVPAAHAMLIGENIPDGYTVKKLFGTTESAYVIDSNKEKIDENGSYSLGIVVDSENSNFGQLVWFSSSNILTDSASSQVSGTNYTVFTNILRAFSGANKSELPQISGKAETLSPLVVTERSANFWSIVLIGIIPIGCISIGLVYWRKRIRK